MPPASAMDVEQAVAACRERHARAVHTLAGHGDARRDVLVERDDDLRLDRLAGQLGDDLLLDLRRGAADDVDAPGVGHGDRAVLLHDLRRQLGRVRAGLLVGRDRLREQAAARRLEDRHVQRVADADHLLQCRAVVAELAVEARPRELRQPLDREIGDRHDQVGRVGLGALIQHGHARRAGRRDRRAPRLHERAGECTGDRPEAPLSARQHCYPSWPFQRDAQHTITGPSYRIMSRAEIASAPSAGGRGFLAPKPAARCSQARRGQARGGSASERFICPSAKLVSIEATPFSRVSLCMRKRS